MAKVAKYLLYAGLGLAALIAWALSGEIGRFVGKSAVESYQEGKQQGVIEKAAEMAAVELRKQLPIQIDEITTLQTVVSAGKTLIYHHRLSLKKSDVDIDYFIAKMRENLKNNVCQQKQMKSILDKGGNYAYSYLSADGLFIGEITITSSDCPL